MLPTAPSGKSRRVLVLSVTRCDQSRDQSFGFRVAGENDLGYKDRLLKLRRKRGEMSWPRFVK